MHRLLLLVVVLLLPAFAVAAEGPGLDEPERLAMELERAGANIGAPFALPDANGRVRRLAEFRGKVVVLYFGFTFCPDVCPTDLANIARAIRDLGKAGRDVQPVFVTLDPARDTPAVLRKYAPSFHPRFVALRGTEQQTREVARAWRQYYRRVPGTKRGEYGIDHAAYAYVIDRRGRFVEAIQPGTPSRRMTEVFREALQK